MISETTLLSSNLSTEHTFFSIFVLILNLQNKYERRLEHVRHQLEAIGKHHHQRKKSVASKSDTPSDDADKRLSVAMVTSKVGHSHHKSVKSKVDSKKVMEHLKIEQKKQQKVREDNMQLLISLRFRSDQSLTMNL